MQTHTTQGRALAIAAGCAFTAGGLTILMGDALLRPQDWTTYHVLTVLTVFGTIAAGHLMMDAARARQALAVVGFLTLLLAGTALVVYQSIGRQGEMTDTKANTAEARNADIATKRADIATARQRLADADKMVEIETRKGGCGGNCKDWKQRAAEVRSHLKTLETEIAALGAPAPVAPKAEKMAAVAALFGANEAKARAALTLIEPFLWTLFFEIGSIVSLGFAFRHRPVLVMVATTPVAAQSSDTDRVTDFPPMSDDEADNILPFFRPDNGSSGGSSGPDKPYRPAPKGPSNGPDGRKEEVLGALLTDLALGRTFGTQGELCGRFQVPRSTMSDWLREWEAAGLIPTRRTVGRRKELTKA